MTNRLAQAQSLYLRKHAENPVDWWFWCDEALEKAQAEDKPIFLSIGYSSCHWCTVMEGEAFSDKAIAEYMNANFVPIKVDREERPDIDSIYMQTLQMMTGQGGWPLNVFLSPGDLIPFYGGTYFPVEPLYGRPSFLEVLRAVRRFYDTEKDKLQDFKNQVQERLQQSTQLPVAYQDPLPEDLLQGGMETSAGILSSSQAPSFPMIPYAELALRSIRFDFESKYNAQQLCTQRGNDLALGGIYDHVGGGFHRYTVDATWTVPHFEKMLYDNGQIVEYLANLWSAGFQEPAFEKAIAGTVEWLQREMTAPEGYFYAAQDADSFTNPAESEPEEGAFYVWRYSQLENLLSADELAQLQAQFTVTPEGNFEGSNVLQRREQGQLSDTLEAALKKLFAARYGDKPEAIDTFSPARNNQEAKTGNWKGRIPPVTDTKMIAAWNSLMISGLGRAYAVFGHASYWELATRAANFILERQWVNGRFHRLNYAGETTVLAQSEDYALFIKALLDLHACHPEQTNWLEKATQIQEEFDEYLWSVELGGYYNTASDASQELLVRERSYIDNALPAANGVACANLTRLYLLNQNPEYLKQAERGLKAFVSVFRKAPQACPGLFTALDWYRHPSSVRTTPSQLSTLIPKYHPSCTYQISTELPSETVGLVCQGLSCLETAQSQQQLLEQIQQSQK